MINTIVVFSFMCDLTAEKLLKAWRELLKVHQNAPHGT